MRKIAFADNVSRSDSVAFAIGAGKVPGVYTDTLQGVSDNLNITPPLATLQPHNLTLTYPLDSGEEIRIVSTSASDTGVIHILGLDENKLAKELTVACNGLTPVAIGLWSRVNYMRCVTEEAVGDIKAVNVSDVVVCYIDPAANQSEVCRYSTPRNTTVQLLDIIGHMVKLGGNNEAVATIGVWIRLEGQEFFRPFVFTLSKYAPATLLNVLPISTEGSVDFEVRGIADTTGVSVLVRSTLLIQTIG